MWIRTYLTLGLHVAAEYLGSCYSERNIVKERGEEVKL